VPTYQYSCTSCGEPLEVVQSFTDDALTVCPACGGTLRKLYNAVGIVFKGSGFYRTDSRAGSSSTVPASGGSSSSDSGSSGSSGDSGSSGSTSSGSDSSGSGSSGSGSGSSGSGSSGSGSSGGSGSTGGGSGTSGSAA
jgi:putative FmdB family regulatory protein